MQSRYGKLLRISASDEFLVLAFQFIRGWAELLFFKLAFDSFNVLPEKYISDKET